MNKDKYRFIEPNNIPPRIGLFGPVVTYVALDYLGSPIWLTSVVVFVSLIMLATSIYLRFAAGEFVDVLDKDAP